MNKGDEPTEKSLLITCPSCHTSFKRREGREARRPLVFCAYCGTRLKPIKEKTKNQLSVELLSKAALLQEHVPLEGEVQSSIGQYQLLRSIGKGGMGEVFLAYDTICGRRIALKRIRHDLVENQQLQKRFLREARITSQLTHPAIIPIYGIDSEENLIYYSMPYVEGNTLKQILRRAKDNEKRREKNQDIQSSIPFLIRHFLQVCQAIAYAHSKGVLHRDLKPENIIVGNYGQVMILDWGLAKLISSDTSDEEPEQESELLTYSSKKLLRLTRHGKVVGTIAFMAPERALGKAATIQTDIYSLGVMLYQILTLSLPFHRKSLSHFKSSWYHEQLIAPEILAPYRDVPQVLSEIVKKCLAITPELRYRSVDELILSLENYIEGRSEWFCLKTLNIHDKKDWLFHENILIAEHIAITRATEATDWASLMVSKDAFPENTKLEAKVRIGNMGYGLGFLLSVPALFDKPHLTEGYCLWLGVDDVRNNKKTQLLRSSINVLEIPDVALKRNEWHKISIEKVDHHIHFYLNDVLQFSYISHIPVIGSHIGVLAHDADFEIQDLQIFIGSQNIVVNCLAVPDAFFATKDYDRALSEYRRIGSSFPGRAEGREALFRAGITLLQQAKNTKDTATADKLYDLALDEFSQLRSTPGAPLEYLGKALVYETLHEYDEEVKCFELAIRRYKNHPLLPILEEQILFRMHESSRESRSAAYNFINLVTRFLPHIASNTSASKLFESLKRHWEVPIPLVSFVNEQDQELSLHIISLAMAFWLVKPYVIGEIIDDILQLPKLPVPLIVAAEILAIELGAVTLARSKFEKIRSLLSQAEQSRNSKWLHLITICLHINAHDLHRALTWLEEEVSVEPSDLEEATILFLIRKAIDIQKLEIASQAIQICKSRKIRFSNQALADSHFCEVYFYQNDDEKAEQILHTYSKDQLVQESSPLYFTWGAYLAKKYGKESAIRFFSHVLDVAFPRSSVLGAQFLSGKIELRGGNWIARSFMWERRKLYSQLALFWYILGDREKAYAWRLLEAKEYYYES